MPKGSYNKTKTHCPSGHPYDAVNTAYSKQGNRICRACSRERSKAAAQRPERKEYARAWYAANRDKTNANNRKWRASHDPFAYWLWRCHGLRPEDWAALWAAQDGRCYLCDGEMEKPNGTLKRNGGTTAVIDHDHSCCPRGKSCSICRRGLAHVACNSAVGLLFDDPVRFRRAADAFEAAQLAVQKRKQGTAELLFLHGGR